MKLADVKNIAGIQFIYPSELKEQLYKRYSSPYELGKGCDRDTLRQFAKEFGDDTRKLKKDELIDMVWAELRGQVEKTETAIKFLIDKSAPVNASDINRLMSGDLSPDSVSDAILASLVTYKDLQGHSHSYEDSTIVKTYLPKINRALLQHGDEGKAVSKRINNKVKSRRIAVKKATKINKVKEHNNLKPISEGAMLRFIEAVVSQCESGHVSNNWMAVGLALGFLAGRRQSEIFGDSTFTKIDDTHIEFSGQKKMRGTRDDVPYTLPVINADWVIVLLEYLTKADKRGKTSAYVNKTICTCYSRAPRLIKPLGLDFFKDSRVAYGLYHCAHTKPESITIQAYLGKLMGHGENDLETSNSYQKFNLVD